MERKNYVVAVDLGSSNVVVAVAVKNEDSMLTLQAVVSKPLPVESVEAGQIKNIEQAGQAVVAAIAEAGEVAGIRITEAYAGISGDFVRCARHTDYVFVADPQNGVNEQDVKSLFDRMRNLQAPENEVIMEHIPQNYIVDDSQEVQNPIGSFGRKLSSTFNFVLCETIPMKRLSMALKRADVEIAGILPNTMAVAEAVLSPDEKEEGVALVDIGAGVTDVTIYYHNVVRYIASIPIGAASINRDIGTMGVPARFVENLKVQYGSAVAEKASETKMVRVTGRTAREARDILLRNLATVIESRALDIIDFVKEEIKISGYAGKLNYGIVLTGGSANLTDLDELFRRTTKLEVRVAAPEFGITEQSCELVNDPQYATVVGLLIKAASLSPHGMAYVPMPPKVVEKAAEQPTAPVTPPVASQAKSTPAAPSDVPAQPAAATPAEPTPAQSTQPLQPAQPARPVAPVQPEQLLREEQMRLSKDEMSDQPTEDEEVKPKKRRSLWNFIETITKGFETVGDDEEI